MLRRRRRERCKKCKALNQCRCTAGARIPGRSIRPLWLVTGHQAHCGMGKIDLWSCLWLRLFCRFKLEQVWILDCLDNPERFTLKHQAFCSVLAIWWHHGWCSQVNLSSNWPFVASDIMSHSLLMKEQNQACGYTDACVHTKSENEIDQSKAEADPASIDKASVLAMS